MYIYDLNRWDHVRIVFYIFLGWILFSAVYHSLFYVGYRHASANYVLWVSVMYVCSLVGSLYEVRLRHRQGKLDVKHQLGTQFPQENREKSLRGFTVVCIAIAVAAVLVSVRAVVANDNSVFIAYVVTTSCIVGYVLAIEAYIISISDKQRRFY